MIAVSPCLFLLPGPTAAVIMQLFHGHSKNSETALAEQYTSESELPFSFFLET
jgi:hypothetical protein